jgi:hypothetical protein
MMLGQQNMFGDDLVGGEWATPALTGRIALASLVSHSKEGGVWVQLPSSFGQGTPGTGVLGVSHW